MSHRQPDHSNEHRPEYDDAFIVYLETMWGNGYLSQGGDAEVAAIVADVDLSHRRVLDIGCGTGGADLALVRNHDAGHVVGIDVEEGVLQRAHRRIAPTCLATHIEFRHVQPGPLPLADASFDIVFSKDAMIHIADKPALYAEVFRVLRPGGVFVASDWLRGEAPPGAAMRDWLDCIGLTFNLATPAETHAALAGAGLADISIVSRNDWSRQRTAEDISRLRGADREALVQALGEEDAATRIERNSMRLAALEAGDLDPSHLRARRPAAG